jgi:phosphate transport system substrate-binding protein
MQTFAKCGTAAVAAEWRPGTTAAMAATRRCCWWWWRRPGSTDASQKGSPEVNSNVLQWRVLVGVALAALAVAGCGGNNNNPGGGDAGTELSGSVIVDGSSTVAPLSKAAASIYKASHPKVNVTVGASGTGGGFEKFCKGETDISDASRKIKDSEKTSCEGNGIRWAEFIVANDALSVVVNKQNTWVSCLTTAQLKKIWDKGSTVKNWKEIDPSFPDQKLELFGPGTESGTFDYFTAAINGKEDQSRVDYTASENDNVLVRGVAGSKGGLGYFGFTYAEENKDKLKILKVDAGGGCVAPSVAAAQDGSYKPLSRPLFIYANTKSMADKPQVKVFVEFYVEKINEIVQVAKFVPLTAAQKAELASDLENAKEG